VLLSGVLMVGTVSAVLLLRVLQTHWPIRALTSAQSG
jgi:hypothetical protein